MSSGISNFNEHYKNEEMVIFFELTTHCNAGCPQCHRTNRDGLGKTPWLPLKQWTFDKFKKVFSRKVLSNIRSIEFCGTWGDPIMAKDVFKITEYILNESNVNVLFNTNGSIRNSDWWWKFGLLGKERMTVIWAIDGSTQEMHSKYRQNTDLNLIMENMQSFTLAGGHSEIFTIVFKHNQAHLYDIACLSRDHGASVATFVQSNRFRPGEPQFHFIDTNGKRDYLEETSLDNDRSFYWSSLNLNDKTDMSKIKQESMDGIT